jgi:hypothetical protein
MNIFLIDIIHKFYISFVEISQGGWILSGLHANFLQFIQVCDGKLIGLLDIACLKQVDEELLDEEDSGRLRY